MTKLRYPTIGTAVLAAVLLPATDLLARSRIVSAEIEYRVSTFKTKDGKKPTFVAWIEKHCCGHIVSVYASQKMAKMQKKNPKAEIFRYWRETTMKTAEAKTKVDAVSKATPSGGSKNRLVWDFKDADGQPVQAGQYMLKFESIVEGPERTTFNQVTSLPFKLGSRKRTFSKSYTVHYNGYRARKPAIYIRGLKLTLKKGK